MGLREWLARAAVSSPHVLVVEAVGGWRLRVLLEQESVRRGWRTAMSPADADVLAICGHPPAGHAPAIERVWEQLPGPRARIHLTEESRPAVAECLDAAVRMLRDQHAQEADAAARPTTPDGLEEGTAEDGHDGAHRHPEHHSGHADTAPDDSGHQMSHADHATMDHGQMDHGHMGHGDMGHDDMAMAGPGGIALASGGVDRDGLRMDVLHLRLGPVLPYWLPGLVLNLSLQGDVVTEATVDSAPGRAHGHGQSDDAAVSAARRCDAAASVLALAGWRPLACRARHVRDLLLDSSRPDQDGRDGLRALRRRVARSRLLRWSLRDLAPAAPDLTPQLLRGDVHARLLRLLTVAEDDVSAGAVSPRLETGDVARVLPALVTGLELAAVRLTVASMAGFITTVSAPEGHEGSHG